MLNFIICDDNLEFAKRMDTLINNFMMNYDIDSKRILLNGYGKEFKKIVSSDIGFKVYFLDIQTKNGSGLDAARCIREEYDDWVSIIVVVTAYNQYKYDALSNRLYLLDYINKLDNCEKKIGEVLTLIMKHYDHREKTITYEYSHIIKKVEYRHIIYIEKEPDSKRCLIRTIYGEQLINKNLNQVVEILTEDRRFMKVSRSMIINLDQIREFDMLESKITFKNGEVNYLVSRDYRKELRARVGVAD
ncbi:MAG: LytTR family DNA-binding domain-containing protein [Bacilli bacterium]